MKWWKKTLYAAAYNRINTVINCT